MSMRMLVWPMALACALLPLANSAQDAIGPNAAGDRAATGDSESATKAERDAADAQERSRAATLEAASKLLQEKRAEEAIRDYLDPLIAEYETEYASTDKIVFSARTPAESLRYLIGHIADGKTSVNTSKDAIVVGPTYAYAYHTKAYALIEIGRVDQAKQAIDKAIALSPSNPVFLSELAYYYQITKDWQAMYETSRLAEDSSAFASTDELRKPEKARALRGQGFALIELNRLDEAKSKFRESLRLDPGSEIAKNELEYIRTLEKSKP